MSRRAILLLTLGLLPAVTVTVPRVAARDGAEAPDPRVQLGRNDPKEEDEGVRGAARSERLWETLLSFYRQRDLRPAWISDGRLTPGGEGLARALADAGRDGLDPTDYAWSEAQTGSVVAVAATESAPLDADVRLTRAVLSYLTDVLEGRFRARGLSPLWLETPAPADLGPALAELADAPRPDELLARAVPTHPQYRLLRDALLRASEQARQRGWAPLPASIVRSGPAAQSPRRPDAASALLRQRLSASDDLGLAAPSALPAPSAPGLPLAAAVRRFQERHGLTPTGRIDKVTLAELNVPPERRLEQLELNLERWRWLPRRMGERYLVVNVPTFELVAYDHDQPVLRMRVVTGEAGETPTPILTGAMSTVVFNPSWVVPPGITANEILPAMLRDRRYLRRRHLEVIRGSEVVKARSLSGLEPGMQLRQPPGPLNPLGRIKFLFPNPYHVYLHDTPSHALFARSRRDFSHGCMRVERPMELARFVFEGSTWTPERVQRAVASGTEQAVALGELIPVYVTYFTAWVEDDGSVRFAPDIYGHDAAQLPALRDRDPAPPPRTVRPGPIT